MELTIRENLRTLITKAEKSSYDGAFTGSLMSAVSC